MGKNPVSEPERQTIQGNQNVGISRGNGRALWDQE